MKQHINDMMIKVRQVEVEETNREREIERARQTEEERRITEVNENRIARTKERKRQEEESQLRTKRAVYDREVRKAKQRTELGEKAWNEGWELEGEGKSAEAKIKFDEALRHFKEALEILPDNLDLQNLYAITSLKIEGNSEFNEGVEAQKEAKKFADEKKYDEALEKFDQAASKFREGFQRSGDKRFKRALSIVEDQRLNVKQAKNEALFGEIVVEETETGGGNDEEEKVDQINTETQTDYDF